MKKFITAIILFVCFTTVGVPYIQAQSILDKIGNVLKSKKEFNFDLTGTWNYQGAALELESNNVLRKVGSAAASKIASSKIDPELEKIGIKKGNMSITFNNDSTYNIRLGTYNLKGSYSYNTENKNIQLKCLIILKINGKLNIKSSSNEIDLLFDSDKLLQLLTFLGSQSNNTMLKTLSSVAEGYDGMMTGFNLKKE